MSRDRSMALEGQPPLIVVTHPLALALRLRLDDRGSGESVKCVFSTTNRFRLVLRSMTSSHTEAPHKTPTWPERLRDVALLLACAVPLLVLFRLISTGLYSTPETDDFCFSYHYAVDGLFGTVALFYKIAIGRLLPMAI